MNLVTWGGIVVFIAVFWLLLPPFSIVSLDENGQVPSDGEEVVFDAGESADRIWADTLAPSMANATALDDLVAAVSASPEKARGQFGNQAGEGATTYYFARGEGRVVEVKGRRATIDVQGTKVDLLVAPPVFGNTVRDGTGLIDVNKLPGLEEYNAVSAALNLKVENDVMSPLADLVQVDAQISFVGCAKAPSTLKEGSILEFTPLKVEVAE